MAKRRDFKVRVGEPLPSLTIGGGSDDLLLSPPADELRLPEGFPDLFAESETARLRGKPPVSPEEAERRDRILRELFSLTGDPEAGTLNLLGGLALSAAGAPMKVVSTAPKVILRVRPIFQAARRFAGLGKIDDAVKLYDKAIKAAKAAKVAKPGIAAMRAERNVIAKQAGKAAAKIGEKTVAKEAAESTISTVSREAVEKFKTPFSKGELRKKAIKSAAAGTGVFLGVEHLISKFTDKPSILGTASEFTVEPAMRKLGITGKQLRGQVETSTEESALRKLARLEEQGKVEASQAFRVRRGEQGQRILGERQQQRLSSAAIELEVLKAVERARSAQTKAGLLREIQQLVPEASPSQIAAALTRPPNDLLDLIDPVTPRAASDNEIRRLILGMAGEANQEITPDVAELAAEIESVP